MTNLKKGLRWLVILAVLAAFGKNYQAGHIDPGPRLVKQTKSPLNPMGRLLENVWIYRTDLAAYNRGLHKRHIQSNKQRQSKRYWYWRAKVLVRDHYKCRECGKTREQTKLEAHHIEEWFENPNLRFQLSNGLTLCIDCHTKIHPWMIKHRKKKIKQKPKIFNNSSYSQEQLKNLIPSK